MSKGVIIENLGRALYRVQILPDEKSGKAQITDIEEQLADIEDPDKVDPGLLTEWDVLYFNFRQSVGGYEEALQTNISTWRQSQVYDNQIAYKQIEINELQPQVSEAWQEANQAEQAASDAYDQYIAGEITWEEYQVYQNAYNAALMKATSLQIQLDNLTAEKAQLETEKAELPVANTSAALDDLNDVTGELLEIREDDHLLMYDQHLEYANSVVDEISTLVSDTIGYYNDVLQTNIENSERAVELQQEMAEVADQIVELRADVEWKKSVLDSTEAAFEEAQERYEAGEITWTELMIYQNNYENALMDYNLAQFELDKAEQQLDEMQQEVLTLTQVDADPIMNDIEAITQIQIYATEQRDIIEGDYERLELRKESLEKRKQTIQGILDSQTREAEVWCADSSTEIPEESEVGLMDIAGVPEKQVIYPGAHNEAGYDSDRDGILEAVRIQTPAQAVYNWAMLPGWQKWMPTYRIGTITSISGDFCDVTLDAAKSPAQNLDVNQTQELTNVPIEYMTCNGGAFEEGDRVVVEFQGHDWSSPRVIGFEKEPQKCGFDLRIIRDSETGIGDVLGVDDLTRIYITRSTGSNIILITRDESAPNGFAVEDYGTGSTVELDTSDLETGPVWRIRLGPDAADDNGYWIFAEMQKSLLVQYPADPGTLTYPYYLCGYGVLNTTRCKQTGDLVPPGAYDVRVPYYEEEMWCYDPDPVVLGSSEEPPCPPADLLYHKPATDHNDDYLYFVSTFDVKKWVKTSIPYYVKYWVRKLAPAPYYKSAATGDCIDRSASPDVVGDYRCHSDDGALDVRYTTMINSINSAISVTELKQPNIQLNFDTWAASTIYQEDDVCVPTSLNGHRYRCISAGRSGLEEPTWPTEAGGTVVDGEVSWQEFGPDFVGVNHDITVDEETTPKPYYGDDPFAYDRVLLGTSPYQNNYLAMITVVLDDALLT
jgi:hypothetical protein